MKKESVKELTQSEFKDLIKSEKGIVIVDFFAEWCSPCLMMGPVLDGIAEKTKNAKFAKINVDDAPELSNEYQVSSIPCLIFFKNGKEVDRSIGLVNESKIGEKIRAHSK